MILDTQARLSFVVFTWLLGTVSTRENEDLETPLNLMTTHKSARIYMNVDRSKVPKVPFFLTLFKNLQKYLILV